jgi:predicted ATP-dependent endonuclease of OLD family
MDYNVVLDEGLTLFVGKNNAGKTTLMNLIKLVVEGSKLRFIIYDSGSKRNITKFS